MGKPKRVPSVHIGDGANGTGTTLSTTTKGDLFLIKSDGTLITTTAAAQALKASDTVQILSCFANGKNILSNPIKGSDVNTYIGNKYDAPVQQVSYVGFNGTTGSLPTAADEDYRMRLIFKGAHTLSTRSPWFFDALASTGSTGVTQESVAGKIVDDFYANSLGANPYVIAERVSDATKTAVGTGTVSFTFVKGSNVVTCNGDIDDATGGVALVAGAYIVIGAAGDTDSIYKIASVNTTDDTMTLDVPYSGTTATLEDTVLTQSTGAAVAAANLGIKLTGLEIEPLLEDYDQYQITMFEVTYANIGNEGANDSAALITYMTDGFAGNGYHEQVRRDERESQTYAGWHDKTMYYHKKPVILTDDTVGYDSITIEFEKQTTGDWGRQTPTPQIAKVYIPTGTAQSDEDTANSFASIMNGYFSTVLGFTAIDLDS